MSKINEYVREATGREIIDGGTVKRLRLLEPQGEPDIIECDGYDYRRVDVYAVLRKTPGMYLCSHCKAQVAEYYLNDWHPPKCCPNCQLPFLEVSHE